MTTEKQEFFSREYRELFLKLLIENRTYYDLFVKAIPPDIFEADLKRIYEAISNIYEKDISINRITRDVLYVEVNELDRKYQTAPQLKSVAHRILARDIDGLENNIVEKARNWIRRESLKSAISKLIDVIQQSDNIEPERVKKIIDKALVDEFSAIKYSDYNSFLTLPEEINKERGKDKLIRTGFPTLDEHLQGGMGAGEVHTLLGTAKSGKTSLCVQIGVNALKQKKSVVHITLELSEMFVKWKYACCITGMTYEDVQYHFDEAKPLLDKFKEVYSDKLFIKKMPMRKTDTIMIKAFIQSLIAKNKLTKPDLIIIDYDDLMKPIKPTNSEYENAGRIYEDMIELAEYFECPILTPAQVNRQGWLKAQKGEVLTSSEMAHSSLKRMHTYSIITINDVSENKGYLFLDTARIGKQNEEVKFDRDLSRNRFRESDRQYPDMIDVDELVEIENGNEMVDKES